MSNFPHVMIDLETLDTKPSSRILSVGAIRFNGKGQCAETVLYAHPSMEEQKDKGRTTSASTITFWERQSSQAREEAFKLEKDRCSIEQLNKDMTAFFQNVEYVWGNSPSFDLMILRDLFDQFELNTPWKFWQERDVRTILEIFPDPAFISLNKKPKDKYQGIETGYPEHHPLGDNLRQIVKLTRIMGNIRFHKTEQ